MTSTHGLEFLGRLAVSFVVNNGIVGTIGSALRPKKIMAFDVGVRIASTRIYSW